MDKRHIELEKKYMPLIEDIEERVKRKQKELNDLIEERSKLYHEFITNSIKKG